MTPRPRTPIANAARAAAFAVTGRRELWVLLIGAAASAVASLGAHYSLTRASQLADAIVVAPMDFLRLPLIAVVGFALYDEALRAPVAVGAACILAANTVNLWAERRAERRRAAAPVSRA